MAIEELDDLIEELANRLGIYGTCEDGQCKPHPHGGYYCCRSAFSSEMRERMQRAVAVEHLMGDAPLEDYKLIPTST